MEKNPTKYAEQLSIDDLAKLLTKLSDAYYNTGEALVSDEIYDKMFDVLKERDPKNNYFKNVGAPIKVSKEKVKLPFEMGSLVKIKPDKNILGGWIKKYKGKYFLSDKLDGASAQIYKNNSGKIFMYSRGDGTDGQDITHLLKYVASKKIIDSIPNGTSIRGEMIISKVQFKKIKDKMKNARNAVAGLINSKTIDTDVAKITDFVPYAILNPRYSYEKQMELLDSWGFDTVEYKFVNTLSEDILKKYLIERKEKTNYEMDGIVCIDCSVVYSHSGGYNDHEFAFKMILDDQIAETTVEEVLWDPSKDGYLKPKIRVKPIDLVGTTITFVTAFNAKYVYDNKINNGTIVKIIRSGDVIPYIHEIVKQSKEPQMPQFPYKWNSTGVDLILKDETDSNGLQIVAIKLLLHFFTTIGVKYLSEGIITKLVEKNYTTVESIIAAKKEDLYLIDGLGKKMVDKIYVEIDRAFAEMTLETFMAASNKLGRGLGEKKIAEILSMYPQILKEPTKGLYDKIMLVPGFSNTTAELFVSNLENFKKFYNNIAKIKDLTRFDKVCTKIIGNKFKDQTIVFTGIRDTELEKYIISNGGKISTSVSSKTSLLVHADDADTSTSKFVKASELKVKTMKISEFRKI
ncbi:NAD-dependent DNA ligase [Bodo saltans virus]|uniref:DNA ligase (NAD(+)) n=1 Tax=Bodo saltans virus TaxID=2024608 RepID=A0A2H4UTU1_9VIRU|nr:NAD-dependent DNA ligase [Bodo saltans virus]ATZ80360.1 NAD-dependent DNA ligase [Bodo saltans virus]